MGQLTRGSVCTKDNEKIAYVHYRDGHGEVIIIAPGFLTSKDAVHMENLRRKLGESFDVISFDFRGHGESTGTFTFTAKEEQDLDAIIQYARSHYKKIGLIGFSLGASTSVLWAGKKDHEVESIVLVSPPSDFWKIDSHIWEGSSVEDIVDNINPFAPGKGVRPGNVFLPKQRPVDYVGSIPAHIPILFIHGDKDWLVKDWHTEALFKNSTASHKRYERIRDGLHAEKMIGQNPDAFYHLITNWFYETMQYRERGFHVVSAKPLQKAFMCASGLAAQILFFLFLPCVIGMIWGVSLLMPLGGIWYLWQWGTINEALWYKNMVLLCGSVGAYGIGLVVFAMMIEILRRTGFLRLQEGMYPYYSWMDFKWHALKILYLSFKCSLGGHCPGWGYRLFGVQKEQGVFIHSKDVFGPDLITIGSGTLIKEGARIYAHTRERNFLRLKKVKIGKQVVIDSYALILSGAHIEDSVHVFPGAVVPQDAHLPKYTLWKK